MRPARILAIFAMLAAISGTAHAQSPCARLSWGTCDPWVENKNFAGPAVYQLVESATGISDQNVGTDSNIHIGTCGVSPLPDAWRFDDTGCQTGGRLGLNPAALSKACPVMKGLNSLTITNYALDAAEEAYLRLSITYDAFTPSPATRYTLWLMNFDHSFSSVGPTPPDQSTCGGGELSEILYLTAATYLNTANQSKPLGNCGDTDPVFPSVFSSGFALWDGIPLGCRPDAAHNSTWGRVKSLYH